MRFTKVLAAVAVSTALLVAQPPARPRGNARGEGPPDLRTMIQNRVDMPTQRLGLSDAQKAKALAALTDAQNAGQSIRTSLQTDHASPADAIKKNDLAAISQVSANIGTMEGQLTAINAKADAAIYSILTPDQQAKFRPSGFGGGPRMMGLGGPNQ